MGAKERLVVRLLGALGVIRGRSAEFSLPAPYSGSRWGHSPKKIDAQRSGTLDFGKLRSVYFETCRRGS